MAASLRAVWFLSRPPTVDQQSFEAQADVDEGGFDDVDAVLDRFDLGFGHGAGGRLAGERLEHSPRAGAAQLDGLYQLAAAHAELEAHPLPREDGRSVLASGRGQSGLVLSLALFLRALRRAFRQLGQVGANRLIQAIP